MQLIKAHEWLIRQNIITEDAVKIAEECIATGIYSKETSIAYILFQKGIIKETDYIKALSAEYGIESLDLQSVQIQPSLKNVINKSIAQKFSILPITENGNALYIAVDDPCNYMGIEAAKKASGKKVIPFLVPSSALTREITNLYGMEVASQAIDDMSREVTKDAAGISETVDVIDQATGDQSAAEKLVNSLLEQAVSEHASDIHFEPHSDSTVVRFRIDGMLRDVQRLDKTLHRTVISRLKVMGDMDASERRKPQDGRYSFRSHGQDIDLRISSVPLAAGEKIVTRLLNKSEGTLEKKAIGLLGRDYDKYDKLVSNHNGVILVVGPTGSGKSSTMYTMIKVLNQKDVNIMTLEDPVEYNIDGVNQIQVNEKVGMSFALGLRAAMRQDPDIIMIGEIRDGETADIAMRAAITGHLVLSTLHTNDAISAFERLRDIGVEPYLISSAMLGVVSQRLVRKICPNCKEEYIPTEEELKELGDPDKFRKHTFYHGKGCSLCHGTGYSGRTGVFEILLMNSELRRAIVDDRPREELFEMARKNGLITLKENCIELIENGITTISELKRIVNSVD